MESENKKPLMGRIVAIDKYGNESEIMTGEIRSTGGIDSGAALKVDYADICELGGSAECTSAECTLEIKTVSRKRFIKLLMSHGIARNGAKDLADYVRKKYGEYNPMVFLMI